MCNNIVHFSLTAKSSHAESPGHHGGVVSAGHEAAATRAPETVAVRA